ncbi:unnamed protein product, partial [marine sediment metagenome]
MTEAESTPTEINTPSGELKETESPPEQTSSINWGTIGLWAGVIAVLAVLGWGLLKVNEERPDDVAPDFEVTFFDGYEYKNLPTANLSDFEGQPVVLNFWASWCVECKIEA